MDARRYCVARAVLTTTIWLYREWRSLISPIAVSALKGLWSYPRRLQPIARSLASVLKEERMAVAGGGGTTVVECGVPTIAAFAMLLLLVFMHVTAQSSQQRPWRYGRRRACKSARDQRYADLCLLCTYSACQEPSGDGARWISLWDCWHALPTGTVAVWSSLPLLRSVQLDLSSILAGPVGTAELAKGLAANRALTEVGCRAVLCVNIGWIELLLTVRSCVQNHLHGGGPHPAYAATRKSQSVLMHWRVDPCRY